MTDNRSAAATPGATRVRLASLIGARGGVAAAGGLGVFLVGGVLTALVAATVLESLDYTVYAAFSSLIGVLVLGPASSLEQESALRASHSHDSVRLLLGGMSLRGTTVWLLAVVVLVVPAGGWQERLLGSSTTTAVILVVLGTPIVFGAAIGRGALAAYRSYHSIGAANAVTGVLLLALPALLHLAGASWLIGFLAGVLLAFVPALVIVSLRLRSAARHSPSEELVTSGPGNHVTAWLLAGNMLMLGTLLAVPVVLRWHVHDLGAKPVADAQLLVSLSRLSTTAVLSFLPLTVARLTVGVIRAGNRAALPWFTVSAGLGGSAVLSVTVFGTTLVTWLTGRTTEIGLTTIVLTSLPVVALCPAIVAMALSIVRQRWRLIVLAWSTGLAGLTGVAAIDPHGSVRLVVTGIALASALPAVVFACGLALRSRTHQAPTRAAPQVGAN